MASTANLRVVGTKTERVWPWSEEAEISTLGGVILDNDRWPEVAGLLKADDFYVAKHRVVFDLIGGLISRDEPADLVTLSTAIKAHPKWRPGASLSFLVDMCTNVPSAANVMAYAQIVLERSMLRRLMSAGDWICDLGEMPEGQAMSALLARANDRLESLKARCEGLADQSWQRGLNRTESGSPKGNLANIVAILESHPEWRDRLKLDTRSQQILKCGTPVGKPTGTFEDADAVEIAAWMGRPDVLKMTVATTQVREAVLAVASRRPFNPLVDWLDSLVWDEEPRIEKFFPTYCGSAENDYTAIAARNFFLGAVARAREPGCKMDLMLILEGPQGARKTSLLIALAGPEYYAEAMDSPAQKDFYQSLQGRWIVEIAEMQSFTKAEVAKVKQAITAQWDFYRPSYGHYAKNFPRQCVFVGTTNEDDYLRDSTGARRFMPVTVTKIQLDEIMKVRDQLWAEADAWYRKGGQYWTLPASAADEQEARYQEDSWTDVVVRWLEGSMAPTKYPVRPGYTDQEAYTVEETNTTQILTWAIGADVSKHGKPEQTRIGNIMRRLGWARVQKRVSGRTHWVYRRPDTAQPEAKP